MHLRRHDYAKFDKLGQSTFESLCLERTKYRDLVFLPSDRHIAVKFISIHPDRQF